MKLTVDAYTLRLFVAVAEAGSISRAARAVHLSPSALSRRMSELEDTLGAPVFIRSARGLALTDAGRFVLERADRINHEIEALVRETRNLREGELRGTVRLHTNPAALIGPLPDRLRRFGEDYPGVRLAIVERDTHEVLRACLDDSADLGIGVSQAVPRGLQHWPFADDAVHVVFPKTHPLGATAAPATLADVLAFPVIGYRSGGALDGLVLAHGRALVPGFNPRVTVGSFDAICRMIEAGMGVAMLPASALRAYAGGTAFGHRPLADAWARHRRLSIFAPRRTPQPPAVAALVAVLTEGSGPAPK